ncbi:MAG: restriction endonuclease, partial [Candidatus Moranbacteria bacterium]|nr:restriction endonuclease [Candidatus Moranbacteria bacterium]
MMLTFDKNLVANYNSASQKIRVLSESWVLKEIYCPS